MRTKDDIDNAFTYHAPEGDQPERYTAVRESGRLMANVLFKTCPESPERTLALRDVQRAVMMANASIALETPDEQEA